jgi:acyl carrier protein
MDDRKAKIRQFLARFRNQELGDHDDIFALGFINSLLAMQLVNYLQKEFGVTVEDDDLELDNFRTLERMDQFVERKRAVAPA